MLSYMSDSLNSLVYVDEDWQVEEMADETRVVVTRK